MNAFEQLADRQIPAPRKTRQRVVDKRAARPVERQEPERQLTRWRAWCRERREALLAGPYAQAARELTGLLDTLTLDDGDALLESVRRGPWRAADRDTRFRALSLIDSAIVELRERSGLPPFSDPLPNEPPNVFLIVREALDD